MFRNKIKGFIIFLCVIAITLVINQSYKKYYIKTVVAKNKYDFVLNATQLDMKLGAIFSVFATGKDSPKVKWYSSDNQVAVISKLGQVVSKGIGQTIITAKYKNECRNIIVNVSPTAKQDVLIYNNNTTVATATESLNKINVNTFILKLSRNKYKYTGKALKPKVSLTSLNKEELAINKDYVVKYQNNKNPGKGQVIVTGIGDYTGSLIGYFKIEKVSDVSTDTPQVENPTTTTTTTNTNQTTDSSNSTSQNYVNSYTDSSSNNSSSSSVISSTRSNQTKKSSQSSTKQNTSTKTSSSKTDSSKKSNTTKNSSSSTMKNSFSKSSSASNSSFSKESSSKTSSSENKSTDSTSNNTTSSDSSSTTNSSDSNASTSSSDSTSNNTQSTTTNQTSNPGSSTSASEQ